jgi:hypothetical protein
VLLLTSASGNFSCRAALHDALLALASWFLVRSTNVFVDYQTEFFESVKCSCSLAHDVMAAYASDPEMVSAAGTLLSMFSRDRRVLHCLAQRHETRLLLLSRLREQELNTPCSCVLMSVIRDCSAPVSSENSFLILSDILQSPCINVIINTLAQFKKVVIDSSAMGAQTLREKADLLLNAASGLVLNLITRAASQGANDSLLTSGVAVALLEAATYATSSLSTSSNCLAIFGRLLRSQCLKDGLCGDLQHGAKLMKLFLALFHEHTDPNPRFLTLACMCELFESSSCSAVFFKSGGSSVAFDAVKCLAAMHKSHNEASDAATISGVFTFAAAAATSSFVYNPAQWLAELHASGHLRAQSLLLQTLSAASEAISAASILMLLVVPHPSPSFVRPPSCGHIFGTGPLHSSDHPCWISPVSGTHLRSMKDQVDVDRVMQAMRGILAFCETDDLTADSSRINLMKIASAIRALVSKTAVGGSVADQNVLRNLSNVCGAFACLLGHVTYKLSIVAGRLFVEKQRKFKQSEEFSGLEEEHALLSKRSDEVEESVTQRVSKLRKQVKDSDYPEHKAMLIISSEDSTGVNPDEILRQYGTGGSVALVHSGKSHDSAVKSVFLGFSEVEKKPIPFLPEPPHFGEVPSQAAVEGAVKFYKRHNALGKQSQTSQGATVGISKDRVGTETDEVEEVQRMARSMIRDMELHTLDSTIVFILKQVVRLGAETVRPVLNLLQTMLQLESEWDCETFLSSTNSLCGNLQLKNNLVKILQRHFDDLSVVRPCLASLCFILQSVDRDSADAQAMYVLPCSICDSADPFTVSSKHSTFAYEWEIFICSTPHLRPGIASVSLFACHHSHRSNLSWLHALMLGTLYCFT